MIYVVAKTRRQALAVCAEQEIDPVGRDVVLVERLTDVAGYVEGDEVHFAGIPFSLDSTERREVLTLLGIKDPVVPR